MPEIEHHAMSFTEPAPTPGHGRPEPLARVVVSGLTPRQRNGLRKRVDQPLLLRLSALLGVPVGCIALERAVGDGQ